MPNRGRRNHGAGHRKRNPRSTRAYGFYGLRPASSSNGGSTTDGSQGQTQDSTTAPPSP